MDFYIKECASHPVYGVMPEKLRMMDVGKVEALSEAEIFLTTLK